MKDHSLSTVAAHAGHIDDRPDYTPSCIPIHNAVTYTYDSMPELDSVFSGERPGYVYSRFANPTVTALESAVAELEQTGSALACASGMAAIYLALLAAGVAPGGALLAAEDLYGGTHALLTQVLPAHDVQVHPIDMADTETVAHALELTKPAAVLVETISNPLLRITNIPAVAAMAHRTGSQVIVDNTFATPCLFKPMQNGADYVVHSATKYLGGHGDVTAGVIASSAENCSRARELQKLTGGILGPNEAWLVLRGLKTLVVRMRQHCQNALAVAHFLSSHSRVSRVYYPGLSSHPQFALGRQLLPTNLQGGVVSFEMRDAEREDVFRFMDALELIATGTSLGDVTSLMLYPAHSSHRSLEEVQRLRLGITPGLVRLSVGIEDVADIIADLAHALDVIG